MNCRACKSNKMYKFLDLGNQPPADQFRGPTKINDPVVYYPLNVFICEDCGLVQLGYIVDPVILYQDNYPYESSTTITGQKHYYDFAKSVVESFNISSDDYVMDIGSNVGVLLQGFKNCGTKILGVDPAANICEIANNQGIPTYNAFFNEKVAVKLRNQYGLFSVITGTNVFAHIDDWDSLVKGVVKLLDSKKGVFIIESPHFLHLLKSLEYDTIYHEHLNYISIEPLVPFFDKYNMEIIKIEQKDIHGGSIRIFVSKKGNYKIEESVAEVLYDEKLYGIRSRSVLDDFAIKVKQNRDEIIDLIYKLKKSGKRVVCISAPAKGMTLLNYCSLGKDTFDYIAEKSLLKIGLLSPGGNIPIVTDAQLIKDNPDYAILLAWNFSKEIMANLEEYKRNGGKFIVPIPKPVIL